MVVVVVVMGDVAGGGRLCSGAGSMALGLRSSVGDAIPGNEVDGELADEAAVSFGGAEASEAVRSDAAAPLMPDAPGGDTGVPGNDATSEVGDVEEIDVGGEVAGEAV